MRARAARGRASDRLRPRAGGSNSDAARRAGPGAAASGPLAFRTARHRAVILFDAGIRVEAVEKRRAPTWAPNCRMLRARGFRLKWPGFQPRRSAMLYRHTASGQGFRDKCQA